MLRIAQFGRCRSAPWRLRGALCDAPGSGRRHVFRGQPLGARGPLGSLLTGPGLPGAGRLAVLLGAPGGPQGRPGDRKIGVF